MKYTLVTSTILFSTLAFALPTMKSRTDQTVNIKLETSDDSADEFTTQDIPLGVKFYTSQNPQLTMGTSVSVNGAPASINQVAISCTIFGSGDHILGVFGPNTFKFSQEPVAISAIDCEITSSSSGGNPTSTVSVLSPVGTDSAVPINNPGTVLPPLGTGSNLGGFANIQLDIDSETTIQQQIAIGVEVSTKDVPRLAKGIDAILQGATGVLNESAITCQALAGGKPVGGPFTTAVEAKFTGDMNKPVAIDAIVCH